MHRFVQTLLILLVSLNGFSQDEIYKKDNSKISCKVVEVGPKTVKYSLSGGEEPYIEVNKSELLLIQYANGEHEVFNKVEQQPMQAVPEPHDPELPDNLISFNFTDIAFLRFQVLFEHLNADRTLGYRLPLAIGYYEETPSIFSGFDLNIYPGGQKKISYFFGPKIRGGFIHDPIFRDELFAAVMFNNGVSINTGERVNLAINFSLGAVHSFDYDLTIPMVTFAFLLGFRF